ncbi:MAG: PH domain-containing protein [Gemmataceae bacterium]
MQTSKLTYHCPHCQAELLEEWAEPGGVVRCRNPQCMQRSMLDLPRAEPELTEDELKRDKARVVGEFTTPMVRRHPLRFVGLAILIVMGGLLVAYSWPLDSWVLFGIGLGSFVLGSVLVLAWWLQARASSLTVTTEGLIFRDGILSERVCEVSHLHVTDIAIFRSWLPRLFGTGSIQFSWGNGQHEIVTVNDPHAVVELVRSLREREEKQPA